MKCPSCGAEVQGKFCEYCGSEVAKESSSHCPKCGSAKVAFKRERVGTATKSTSYKSVFGTSRQKQSITQAVYRTVGVCQNCGHTWNSGGNTKRSGRKTWLLVLGWICIFPVPLTILMLRKKNMKPAVKYGIIAVAWLLYFAMGASGNNETAPSETPAPTEVVVIEQLTEVPTEEIPTEATVPEETKNKGPYARQEANIRRFVDEFNAISDTPVDRIEFINNHTLAYLVIDGFGELTIKVNDHSEMGFFFTLHFSNGIASLEKYEALMRDIIKVFDENGEIGDKFQEANANQKTNVYLSDSIYVEYHYVKDAVGFQSADNYIITLTSTEYNKQ